MVDFVRKPTVVAPKAGSKPVSDVVEIKGLEALARLDAAAKAYKAACETVSREVKAEACELFIGQGIQLGKRPANLKAAEGKASASIQLKASPSALTEDAVAKLEAAKIPLRSADQVAETFVFNPAYIEDSELLEKIKKALNGIKGIPEDLIQFQSQKKIVCDGDATIDAIFRLKAKGGVPDRNKIETLLPLVTTLAIKPTTTESLEDCLDGAENYVLGKEDD